MRDYARGCNFTVAPWVPIVNEFGLGLVQHELVGGHLVIPAAIAPDALGLDAVKHGKLTLMSLAQWPPSAVTSFPS